MKNLYSKIVNVLHTRNQYTLRSFVSASFNYIIGFFLWRSYSTLRFGNTRWIQFDWGRLCVNSRDYRAYWIARSGGTQKETIRTWINLAHLKPDLCIDVGTNYGEFTASIISFGIPTISIEANPNIVNCLKMSFVDHHNISVIHAAASDKNEITSFYFNDQFSGTGSISNEKMTPNLYVGQKTETQTIKIRSVRLDSLVLNELKIKPKSIILKIDVETFEINVIKGALPMLEQCDWWRIITEFNPDAIKQVNGNVDEVWNTYRNFNGMIINSQNISETKSLFLTCNLPDNPPSFPCDILIGYDNAKIIPKSDS